MKTYQFIILILISSFCGCSKEDIDLEEIFVESGEDYAFIKDNVFQVSNELLANFESINDEQFIFRNGANISAEIEVGSYLYFEINDTLSFQYEVLDIAVDGVDLNLEMKSVYFIDLLSSYDLRYGLEPGGIKLREDCDFMFTDPFASCTSNICFKMDELNPDFRFCSSESGSPNIIFDIGNIVANIDYQFQCNGLRQSEPLKIGILAAKELFKKVTGVIKNGIKEISISADGSISVGDGSEGPELLGLAEFIDRINLDVGLLIKDAEWEGDFHYIQNVHVGIEDIIFKIQLNTTLTDLVSELEFVTLDPSGNVVGKSNSFNELNLGCVGEFKIGLFGEMGVSAKEEMEEQITDRLKFKLPSGSLAEASFEVGTHVKVDNNPASTDLKGIVNSFSKLDFSFFDFPVDPITSYPIRINDFNVTLECPGIFTNVIPRYQPPSSQGNGLLVLDIDGDNTKSFNLYYGVNGVYEFIENNNYGITLRKELNSDIESVRLEDSDRPKCAIEIPLIPNVGEVGDEGNGSSLCTQNYSDSRDGELYCTLKVCPNNNQPNSNCITWLRRNLRYRSGNSIFPNGSSDYWRLGSLYSWDEVKSDNICPNNYRVATIEDYEHLFDAISNNGSSSGDDVAGQINAPYGWSGGSSGDGGEIYSKYFELFPNGYYSIWDEKFQEIGESANLWTLESLEGSTESVKALRVDDSGVGFVPFVKDAFRLGVRCVCESGCN